MGHPQMDQVSARRHGCGSRYGQQFGTKESSMPGNNSDPFIEAVLSALKSSNVRLAVRVNEKSHEIRSAGFHTPDGAFVGALEENINDKTLVAQIQTYAATSASDTKVDEKRRGFLKNFGLAALGGGAVFSGWGMYVIDEFRKDEPYEFDDAFIRQVISLRSNRPALYDLHRELQKAGKFSEAELIYLVTRHGTDFHESEVAIATMAHILSSSRQSDLSDAFIRLNFCTHFRYIGLPLQCFYYGDELKSINYEENPHFQTGLINQRHMNLFHTLYGKPNFNHELRQDTQALASSYSALVGASSFDPSPQHIGHSINISLETLALCGMAHSNRIISCDTEEEAKGEFFKLMPFFLKISERSKSAPNEYLKLGTYGESIWPIGRMIPFALINGWVEFAGLLLRFFYDGLPTLSDAAKKVHDRLHVVERAELNSPIWIQVALLTAVWEEQHQKTGAQWLDSLLPLNQRHRVYGHSLLARALVSLEVTLGRDPWDVPSNFTFANAESKVLLHAVDVLRKQSSG